MAEAAAHPRREGLSDPPANLGRRKFADRAFVWSGLLATAFGLSILVALVLDLYADGAPKLTWAFFTSFPAARAADAGVLAGWVGSILLMLTTALIAIPLGVLAGIYLEEYAPKNVVTSVLEIAVNNLAGVPSIVYGLLGLGVFLYSIGNGTPTVLVAGLTLALLILPIIIVATREAVRSVPSAVREASLALGATKWRTTADHVLPYATPGIVTGVIIGLSRAIGETAPLIVLSVPAFIQFVPMLSADAIGKTSYTADGGVREIGLWDVLASWSPFGPRGWLNSEFTVVPMQMYDWTEQADTAFAQNAAAAGLVILVVTLALNALAIWYRYRMRRRIRW